MSSSAQHGAHRLFLLALTIALFTPRLSAFTENTASTAHPTRRATIVVNSSLSGDSTVPGKTTLTAALRQAMNDPRDNEIVFAPAAFHNSKNIVQPAATLLVKDSGAGHDRIDGRLPNGSIVLDVSLCSDAGILIRGDGRLSLSRLTIRGGNQRTILIKDRGRLQGEELTIEGSGGPGVALFQEAVIELVDCRITNHLTHGIELHERATLRIDNSRIDSNRQSGIAAFNQARIETRQCRIQSNGDWNLVLKQESQALLTDCQLDGSRFANLDLGGSARLQANQCIIRDGNKFGLFATDGPVIQLVDTVFSRHGGRGIEIQDAGRITLLRTRIESSGDYGVILFGRSVIEATDSLIRDNTAHGVCLRDQAAGRFELCRFEQNRLSGIGCADHADGGIVQIRQCLFHDNGLRPIYRGPLHIDPLVPTPLSIRGPFIECLADPGAEIDLYIDRAGEAAKYFTTLRADAAGRFELDSRVVPEGFVMTATATTIGGATSEFNVIAGTNAAPVINALLGKTGPLSDNATANIQSDTLLRRWQPGSHLILQMENPPPATPARAYAEFLVARTNAWTAGALTAELRVGPSRSANNGQVVIPVRYVPAQYPDLIDRGGVIYMRWDTRGLFVEPMRILLADGDGKNTPCPRVLAHEWGHALGLYHARVGLLSRMQGSQPPPPGMVNDFSPTLTFYDVLALQMLYHPDNHDGMTLGQLTDRRIVTTLGDRRLVRASDGAKEPVFSPQPPPMATPASPR